MLKNILLVIVSISIVILAIEWCLRAFYPQILEHNLLFQPDNTLGWRFIPNQTARMISPGEFNHEVKINSTGFRDFEEKTKEPMKSIWVTGDSFVSNLGVQPHEVFTELLQSRFDSTTVFNLGVNGYSTVQSTLLLQQLLQHDTLPDFIIHVIYLRNDLFENTQANWSLPRPIARLNQADTATTILPPDLTGSEYQLTMMRKLPSSHLLVLVKNKWRNIRSGILEVENLLEPETQYCNLNYQPIFESKFQILKDLIIKMHGEASDHNIPMLFVLAPSLIQVEDLYWNRFLEKYQTHMSELDRSVIHRRLMNFAQNRNLLMIDLLPTLIQTHRQTNKSMYRPIEQHWTAEANQVVANVIYNDLIQRFIIK